jgi:hypothetical protein
VTEIVPDQLLDHDIEDRHVNDGHERLWNRNDIRPKLRTEGRPPKMIACRMTVT